jgi:two-component system, OmpR family, catabolic regulation response regulator CreB
MAIGAHSQSAMPRILIVEDEVSIADTLKFALEDEGHEVVWLRLGRDAIESSRRAEVDLIVLDVGLPDQSGFEVCKQIRKHTDIPILFLTARSGEIDRIVGLEIGGDDYVVKPFSPREVAVRVRTILKRTEPRSTGMASPNKLPSANTLGVHDGVGDADEFLVDRGGLKIAYQGTTLKLTALEFRLLDHLLAHPGRVFSRAQLLETLGLFQDTNYERNVDGHIKTLRGKLREVAPLTDPIVTHRGFGYSYQPRS